MFYTYILENPKGKLYIGQTDDLVERVNRHNRGGKNFTSKGPWNLVYFKEFQTRKESIEYEKYLKGLKNPKYIRSQIIEE